jgi:hypothetical protein
MEFVVSHGLQIVCENETLSGAKLIEEEKECQSVQTL